MSFKSVLSDIGNGISKVFKVGVAVASDAEPFVDIAFPGVAPLFNAVVQQVAMAEASAAAAGAETGSGTQKLALVLQSIEGSITEYEKKNNITTPLTQLQMEALANSVVAFLNALPANSSAAASNLSALAEPEPAMAGV